MSGKDNQRKRILMGVCEYIFNDQGYAGGVLWLSGVTELTPNNNPARIEHFMPSELWRDIKSGKPSRAQVLSMTGCLRDILVSCDLFDESEDMVSVSILCLRSNAAGDIVDSWIVTVAIEGGFAGVPQGRLVEIIREAISSAEYRRASQFSRSIH